MGHKLRVQGVSFSSSGREGTTFPVIVDTEVGSPVLQTSKRSQGEGGLTEFRCSVCKYSLSKIKRCILRLKISIYFSTEFNKLDIKRELTSPFSHYRKEVGNVQIPVLYPGKSLLLGIFALFDT